MWLKPNVLETFSPTATYQSNCLFSKLTYRPTRLVIIIITLIHPRLILLLTISLFVLFLAPAVTVGETKRAMDSTSVFFWPFLLPITL